MEGEEPETYYEDLLRNFAIMRSKATGWKLAEKVECQEKDLGVH